jgi:hypothetical protein
MDNIVRGTMGIIESDSLDWSGQRRRALDYGTWIQKNCITTHEGFRCSLVDNWRTEISNEEAYELYLESLKSK